MDIHETKKERNHAVCFGPGALPVRQWANILQNSYHRSKATKDTPYAMKREKRDTVKNDESMGNQGYSMNVKQVKKSISPSLTCVLESSTFRAFEYAYVPTLAICNQTPPLHLQFDFEL